MPFEGRLALDGVPEVPDLASHGGSDEGNEPEPSSGGISEVGSLPDPETDLSCCSSMSEYGSEYLPVANLSRS